MSTAKLTGYEKIKEDARKRNAALSESGRDIGDIPGVVDSDRRDSCRNNFRLFCETYLSGWFPLAWSDVHLNAIARIEETILRGGQYAFAMPRGSGKTTLCIAAALWAVLYGHRRFVVLIGAESNHAGELADSWKMEIETNDLLLEDFPEACYPIRKLEGINHRAGGQTYKGERTRIEWSGNEAKLAMIPGAACSGGTIRVAGITGRIRGMKSTIGKEQVRPDLVIVDDPQTDESAASPSQNATREKLLSGAVLGLSGPGKKIAAFLPCTVIAPGDMAERILDREKNPQWHGERTKMVIAFPTNVDEWETYYQIRGDDLRNGGRGEPANEYYRERREIMDVGSCVYWAERFNEDEISAIQSAMNLKQDRPHVFWAEFQNAPLTQTLESENEFKAEHVFQSLNNLPHRTIPASATRLTVGIDVGSSILWHCVSGWNEYFGGSVVDYGCWPGQKQAYFQASRPMPGLDVLYPNATEESRIFQGLTDLVNQIMATNYTHETTGARVTVDRICIDSGWQTDTVIEFCRRSQYSSIIIPTKGKAITTGTPISDWQRKPGERADYHWRYSRPLLVFDPNQWKSLLSQGWKLGPGTSNKIGIYGKNSQDHALFADHLAAEYATRLKNEKTGREFDAWARRPNQDNHWLDAFVLSGIAASFAGLKVTAAGPGALNPQPRKKVKYSEMYYKKHGRN